MDPNLLSITEAAAILHVHPATLRRWDTEGQLKAVIINDRGDRKYRQSEILEFLGTNPKIIKYAEPIIYKNCKIIWDSQGFINFSGRFGVIARIIVQKENEYTGFAFATSGLQMLTQVDKNTDLDQMAINHVKDYIDQNLLTDEDVYTFEYAHNDFKITENPEWWEGKYSKTLVKGLRIEAHHTVPTTTSKKAWRVIVKFLSKEDGGWLTRTFGEHNNFFEYYVWVDSQELNRLHLPESAKNAEIIAIDFMIKRFQETKDKEGIRDITRINEKNAACINGKCIKGQVLPE